MSVEMMLFTNPTSHTINLDPLGLDQVAPGEDVAIPLHLAAPTRGDNGTRGKSAVESVAPQLHPKDPTDHEAWKKVPAPPTAESKIVSISSRPASEAPGVKALRDQREAELAKAKAKAIADAAKKATGASTANVSK